MKKLFLLCIVAIVFAACTKQPLPQASYDVIPQPKEVQLTEEKPFELNSKTVVYYEAGLQREAKFLSEYVNEIMGCALNIQEMQGNETKGIVLQLAPDDFEQAESYEINIAPKQIIIKGADAAGVFYGIQTLRKSLPVSPIDSSQPATLRGNDMGEPTEQLNNCQLPTVTIRDWPNFGYRGMHLDPCRHFMDLDSVKIYLDMMALHNMNQFHFHLSEDQGWRIEIKKYPELTEIGAYRSGTVIGHNGQIYDTIRHGGFYTQDELRDLIQYAAERHINIIPEIDLPGHM